MALTLRPHAKINLGLLILGKRSDGYHLLETLFLPVYDLRDELSLEVSETRGCSIVVEGVELAGDPQDNLCCRAYRLLAERFPDIPGIAIRLKKNIPAGAGLGGGSSDAASTLRGINKLLGLDLTLAELSAMAARLGADVPFFLHDRPMFASGTGTELEAFDLELPYRIELLTPDIHSSTIAAYKALDYRDFDPERSLKKLLALPPEAWREHLPNDLETPVFRLYPELRGLKEELYRRGAVYAAMSGSGSAVFGLFHKAVNLSPIS